MAKKIAIAASLVYLYSLNVILTHHPVSLQKSKIKLAKPLSDIVIYCKSVHFNGFEHAKDNQAFYEMSSFKESKAFNLADTSGKCPTNHTDRQYYEQSVKSVLKCWCINMFS